MTDDVALAAEQAVLGAALHSRPLLEAVIEGLDSRDFGDARHREVFSAIRDLYDRGEDVDCVTVAPLCSDASFTWLTSLLEAAPFSPHEYVRLVREGADRRRLRERIAEALDDLDAGDDPTDIREQLEARVFELGDEQREDGRIVSGGAATAAALEGAERARKTQGRSLGPGTGLYPLDRYARLQPGRLIVLGARPSMGKSALAQAFTRHVADVSPVLHFSLEMMAEELGQRDVAALANLDLSAIQEGRLTSSQWGQARRAQQEMEARPIEYDCRPSQTVAGIRHAARRYARRAEGLGLIVIDYLQLLESHGSPETRNLEVAAQSRALKSLAMELRVPVVLLSQLSRAVEHRSDKRPTLADLRDSGAIEQDADTVLLLHRPEVYMEPEKAREKSLTGRALIHIAKNRNGPTGWVQLHFSGASTRFVPPDRQLEAVR